MDTQDNHAMWEALNQAYKARALVYVEFFRAIEKRFGRDTAVEVTKEAIYNWGRSLAGGLERHLPSDFKGLCSSFAYAPDGGAMFTPKVFSCSEQGLDVQFETCPLKTGWVEAGLGENDLALFCDMAAQADYGTLEAAGFSVDIQTWTPGSKGCCLLKIRPGQRP
jgi:L-2-amino-thiazoline-4-carboxylic acid hydrolase